MSRPRNVPNQENCTLDELETAASAAPIQRTNLRLMAIKALTMGIPHEQVAVLFDVNGDSVSRWEWRFNERGIDERTEGPRSGRPPKIRGERVPAFRELNLHPESVDETHWKGRKVHGYLTNHCQLEAVYSALMRELHQTGQGVAARSGY